MVPASLFLVLAALAACQDSSADVGRNGNGGASPTPPASRDLTPEAVETITAVQKKLRQAMDQDSESMRVVAGSEALEKLQPLLIDLSLPEDPRLWQAAGRAALYAGDDLLAPSDHAALFIAMVRRTAPGLREREPVADLVAALLQLTTEEAVAKQLEYRERALRLHRKAQEGGDADAQNELGKMYDEIRGVVHDPAEAVKWLRESAEQGYAPGQENLANMLSLGLGVPQNHAKAAEWYRKAAEQGNADAQNNLGSLFLRGLGVPQDDAEAFRWFHTAAKQGHALGQWNTGWGYFVGEGVPKDRAEGLRWIRKAAAQENVHAQEQLGVLYAHGDGVRKDLAKAARWFRRAAEQGAPFAQHQLGIMYESGLGVPRNYYEAVKWLRKAARQGHRDARQSLRKWGERW